MNALRTWLIVALVLLAGLVVVALMVAHAVNGETELSFADQVHA